MLCLSSYLIKFTANIVSKFYPSQVYANVLRLHLIKMNLYNVIYNSNEDSINRIISDTYMNLFLICIPALKSHH